MSLQDMDRLSWNILSSFCTDQSVQNQSVQTKDKEMVYPLLSCLVRHKGNRFFQELPLKNRNVPSLVKLLCISHTIWYLKQAKEANTAALPCLQPGKLKHRNVSCLWPHCEDNSYSSVAHLISTIVSVLVWNHGLIHITIINYKYALYNWSDGFDDSELKLMTYQDKKV